MPLYSASLIFFALFCHGKKALRHVAIFR